MPAPFVKDANLLPVYSFSSLVENQMCKWMEIENALLSEVTQTQKEEYGMYSLISGF